MSTNPIWIAGYGAAVAGAAPVWIAGWGGAVAGAAEAWIAGYGGTPTGGASPVWIGGYGGTPTGGASPVWIGGTIESGGAPAHSAQALAYLARTVGGNEGGNGTNIATLIDGLVADGVWANLDALYVFAQQNATDAVLNLISTSYGLTLTGSPTFVSLVGYSGFTPSAYLNTGFNAATAPSPHFIQNSASFGFWSDNPVSGSAQMGNTATSNAGESNIFDDLSGAFYARVNNPSIPAVAITEAPGFFVGDRSSSANVVAYFNGAGQAAQSGVSAAPQSTPFTIGFVAGQANAAVDTLSAAFIGGSLGAAGQLALYNRLRTYMTAVGVP